MNKEDWVRVSDKAMVRKTSIYLMGWSKRDEDWFVRLEFLDGSDGGCPNYINVTHGYEGPFISILGPRPD